MSETPDKSAQYGMLLEQKYAALGMIDKANDALDDKASKILQASSIIVALAGLLSSPLLGTSIPRMPIIPVAAILLAFMIMVALSIVSVAPSWHYLPGTQNWTNAYEQYILNSAEDAFTQILSDLVKVIDLLSDTNARKANLVRISAYLLLTQIVALLFFLFITSLP